MFSFCPLIESLNLKSDDSSVFTGARHWLTGPGYKKLLPTPSMEMR
ncbi:hypothetical protein CCACVL1_04861 [Corchorus capsularis]|uniref:Uncharacterized protein n=1 Tax=Corchorus capsularis TaxID=210143 RepID=A0A1R3JP64_COCAP|nr:hypothetical protein CCACVL1_04861 [Corchorus capsularis]